MREYSIDQLRQVLQSRDSIFNKKDYISQYFTANVNDLNALEEGISEIIDSPSLNDAEKIQFCFDAGPKLIGHSFKKLKAKGLEAKEKKEFKKPEGLELETNDLELEFLKYALNEKFKSGPKETNNFIISLEKVIEASPEDKQKVLDFILRNDQLHIAMKNEVLKASFLETFEKLPDYNKEDFERIAEYNHENVQRVRIQAIKNSQTLTSNQKIDAVMKSSLSDKDKLDFCFAHAKNLSLAGKASEEEMTKIIDAIIDNNLFEKALQREDVHKSDLGAKLNALQVVANRIISKDKVQTNQAEIFSMVKDTGLYSELKEIAAELKSKSKKDLDKIVQNPRLGLFGGIFSSNQKNLETKKQVKSFVTKLKEEKAVFDRHKALDQFRR
jgi:hypothetical protein